LGCQQQVLVILSPDSHLRNSKHEEGSLFQRHGFRYFDDKWLKY